MKVPVVYGQCGHLLSLSFGSGGCNQPSLSKRFENALGNKDAVGAIFDALTAAEVITSRRINELQLQLSDESYDWVCEANVVICGDSLGLPVLLALLAKSSGARLTKHVAATGALSITNSTVTVRAVSDLALKLDAAAKEGVDTFICPSQPGLPSEIGRMQIHQIREVGSDSIGKLFDG